MNEGDVAIIPLRQADGRLKYRPVVVLRGTPPFGDLLVCGVSTQLHLEVAGFDDRISPGDVDFPACGLKASSLIRLGFLAVIPANEFSGPIGAIDSSHYRLLLTRLSDFLRP